MKNKKWEIWGLIFLLVAWGADYFLLSKAKENLKKIEFAVINSGIVDNSSKLNFIKYFGQERRDPKLLSLSYRDKLEGIAATTLLLQKSGIQPDIADKNILGEINTLLEFVNSSYKNGTSLEPKDIKRNIRHEIFLFENRVNEYLVKCLQQSNDKYKIWDFIFIGMYIIGTILLIIGKIKEKNT